MATCYYTFEIPDLSRPITGGTAMSPSGALMPFIPRPLEAERLVGRRIDDVTINAGTYGMGGPGFLGLKLGADWLVVALWGAASWTTCQGRLVEDLFHADAGRPEPWTPETGSPDILNAALVGQTIEAVDIRQHALCIAISGGFDLTIAEDPAARPVFAGNGEPRAFAPDDDLRRAVFLSPTVELWT